MLEDGVESCLADYQVRPLHHHDADKESRVTGVFQLLPLGIGLCKRGAYVNYKTACTILVHRRKCSVVSVWLYILDLVLVKRLMKNESFNVLVLVIVSQLKILAKHNYIRELKFHFFSH